MRIIAFAYSCEPGAGSEPGAGWVWARMLARLGETWVVTRANNRDQIERALAQVPERDDLHFIYVELPAWARFWKRGNRGARAYYMLWQVAAVLHGRRLDQRIGFNVSWHLTMSTVWLGSLAPFVGHRFILGPVGGGVRMPWRLAGAVGLRGALFELARSTVQLWGRYLNPLARLSWRRAELILVQNPDTRDWLPRRSKEKVHVFPHVVLEQSPSPASRSVTSNRHVALFAGRLLPWKGLALAVRAVAARPEWQLVVCGSGPDEARLRHLTAKLGVGDRIDWRGWQEREAVQDAMQQASVFLFPSLHDEGGWVIVESFANGLPAICLDIGGPPVLGGMAVAIGGLRDTVQRLVEALDQQHDLTVPTNVPTIDQAWRRLAELTAFPEQDQSPEGEWP